MAHQIGNANRSARVERPFYFIENNFLARRTFASWGELNQQGAPVVRQDQLPRSLTFRFGGGGAKRYKRRFQPRCSDDKMQDACTPESRRILNESSSGSRVLMKLSGMLKPLCCRTQSRTPCS